MNRRDAEALWARQNALMNAGVSREDCEALRRISMTLHRWHERECGVDGGCIERDGRDGEGKPYWHSSLSGHRWPIPDRERGALKRLTAIMARYPELRAYVQGDPRGAALYILRPADAPIGQEDSHYSRGLVVY